MPYLATVVREQRQAFPHALLVDAGGWASGTRLADAFEGAPMVEIMNEMGYDGAAVARADLSFGAGALERLAGQARFPLLAANLATPGVRPFVEVARPGCRVGLIGLIDGGPHEEARRALLQSRLALENRVDLVIVLSHRGVEADRRLADEVPGLDCFIGVGAAPLERRGEVVLARSAARARALGSLQVEMKSDAKDPPSPDEFRTPFEAQPERRRR
jgi:2',3'-cyclic-nucleotide 2'-phosphodiesterase (5'-nucleotidase family)